MGNFIELAKIVLGLLPAIINAVKAIEDLFPEGGKGAQKLELIKETLKAVIINAGDQLIKFEDLWKMIQPVIAAVVSFANGVGLFKKSK